MNRISSILCCCSIASLIATAGSVAPQMPLQLQELLRRLPSIQYGKGDDVRDALDEWCARAGTNELIRVWLEEALIDVLVDNHSTLAARAYACRGLQRVGSTRSIGPLIQVLNRPELATQARTALINLPYSQVDQVLREELSTASGEKLLNIVITLGERRDPLAVAGLAELLRRGPSSLQCHVARALGKIATREACEALLQWNPAPGDLQRCRIVALLEAAENLSRRQQDRFAAELYRRLEPLVTARNQQEAVFIGRLQVDQASQVALLEQALRCGPEWKRYRAIRFLKEGPLDHIPLSILEGIDSMPPDAQAGILEAIAVRCDGFARSAVIRLLHSSEPEVQIAAVQALSRVGTTDDLVLLAQLFKTGDRAVIEAVKEALVSSTIPEIDSRFLEFASKQGPDMLVHAVEVIERRGARDQLSSLIGLLSADDVRVCAAAAKAIATLGSVGELRSLLTLWLQSADDQRRELLFEQSKRLISRIGPDAWPVLKEFFMKTDQIDQARDLISLMAACRHPEAVELLGRLTGSEEPALCEAALRTLSQWPDTAAVPYLVKSLERISDTGLRRVVFRAIVARAADLPDPVQRLQIAMNIEQAADSIDLQRALISLLARIPRTEALHMAARYLTSEGLQAEAALAVAQIAEALPEDKARETISFLKKAAEADLPDAVRERVERLLQKLNK